MRRLLPALIVSLLTACAAGPGIPETTYFRLPEAAVLAAAAPGLDSPLVIDTFLADGVHSDQSILYAVDDQGERLRAYHYQLWVDPPTRMLQRRLIRTLSGAGVAPRVLERLPPSAEQHRLQVRITAFERLPGEAEHRVRVALDVRLDRSDRADPLLLREYRRELPAAAGIGGAVAAFAQAIDAIYGELAADLRQLPSA